MTGAHGPDPLKVAKRLPSIWTIDLKSKTVQIWDRQGERLLRSDEVIETIPSLPGFRVPVMELFTVPEWAK